MPQYCAMLQSSKCPFVNSLPGHFNRCCWYPVYGPLSLWSFPIYYGFLCLSLSLCIRASSLSRACLVHTKWRDPEMPMGLTPHEKLSDNQTRAGVYHPSFLSLSETILFCSVYSFWEFPHEDSPCGQGITPLTNALFIGLLPFSVSFLHPLTVFLSQINHLHSKSCLRVCFCRNQIIVVTNNKRW